MATTIESVVHREFDQAWTSGGDLDAIDDLVTDDFEYHNPLLTTPVRGPDAYRRFVEEFHEVFENVTITAEEMLVQDDRIATRFTTRATPREAFLGVEVTDEEIEITGISVDHIEGGKLKRRYIVDDLPLLLGSSERLTPPTA